MAPSGTQRAEINYAARWCPHQQMTFCSSSVVKRAVVLCAAVRARRPAVMLSRAEVLYKKSKENTSWVLLDNAETPYLVINLCLSEVIPFLSTSCPKVFGGWVF